ncbi:phosphate uptake regulator PhoU [Candidatus Woesearchaeota archaeon]|nr:phosphate uptake regulator PhoU [Candidatus Woesearchaeota archaeon]
MRRKVIQLAGKTLLVSLPAVWAKESGISKGDEVEVTPSSQGLCITAKEVSQQRTRLAVDVSNTSADVARSIIATLHKDGYDELAVRYSSPEQLESIRMTINTMLMGYEILEQSKTTLLIKDLILAEDPDLRGLIRRNFLIVIGMAKDLLDGADPTTIESYEETNNKITNYCHRILNKSMMTPIRKNYLYTILWVLENICDDLKRLSRQPGRVEALSSVHAYLEQYYSLYYNYSFERLSEFVARGKELLADVEKGKISRADLFVHGIITNILSLAGSTTGLHHNPS